MKHNNTSDTKKNESQAKLGFPYNFTWKQFSGIFALTTIVAIVTFEVSSFIKLAIMLPIYLVIFYIYISKQHKKEA